MGAPPDHADVLDQARPLVEAGVALHWLRPRSKAPVDTAWSEKPVPTWDDVKRSWRAGYNLGVRLGEPSRTAAGYLHLIDLDIRRPEKAEEAWTALESLWPEVRSFPFVVSGSGGESRHFYLVADRPFRSKKIARSEGYDLVFDPEKGREVKRRHWEIELFGTGKQAVLPPSIHPDTGLAYRWGRPLDLDLLDMGVGPTVADDLLTAWGAHRDAGAASESEDDLLGFVRAQPMGLSEAEIRETLYDLPEEWVEDRDLWLQAGMALHHEYEGKQAGLLLWNEWSSRSKKYDADDQVRVWRSFGESRGAPVRMATLIKAAGVARLERAHETDGDEPESPSSNATDDDIDDLLGDGPSPKKPDGAEDALIAPGALLAPDPNWRSRLQYTEDGKGIRPTLHNVELIVRNDPRIRGVPAFNLLTQEIVQRGTPGTFRLRKPGPKPVKQLAGPIWAVRDPVNGDLWSDERDNAIRAVIEAPSRQGGYSLKVTDRDLKAAIDLVAREQAFHPIRDYLSGLVWDGVPRLDTVFIRYLGCEDTPYSRAVSRLTLLGGVVRAFEPGHKFDFVPILEGLQGKRKSSFIEILARHWFAELQGDFHDRKSMVEKMQGSWILEIPELSGFGKSEVQEIKAFVSARKDKVRLSYERRAREFDRQCIFIGSTNDREYLRDQTGGRRFWPVECSVDEIDTTAFEREVDQLWAEAKAAYDEMRAVQPRATLPLYLSDEAAKKEALALQEERRVETAEDNLAGVIGAWLDGPLADDLGFEDADDLLGGPTRRDETCLMEIWCEMLHRDRSQLDQRASQWLGRAMKQVEGWHNAGQGRTKKYGKQRIYRRSGTICI